MSKFIVRALTREKDFPKKLIVTQDTSMIFPHCPYSRNYVTPLYAAKWVTFTYLGMSSTNDPFVISSPLYSLEEIDE